MKNRTLVAFSIHGRTGESIIDYKDFFSAIRDLAASKRGSTTILGQTMDITDSARLSEDVFALRVISGNRDESPVFYNPVTGAEEDLAQGEGLFGVGVWFLVNTSTRIAAVESKRPGISVGLLERFFQKLGSELGYEQFSFDLHPVTRSEFDEAVLNLDQIKKVTVAVSRPNFDWDDEDNALHDYADESQASTTRVEMSAKRGESLSKTKGIVSDVVGLSRKKISSLKNVIVEGIQAGQSGRKTINLQNFQVKKRVPIERGATPREELSAFEEFAGDLLTTTD